MEEQLDVARDTVPKPFVFVLMPFDDAFDDVYKLGIKPACENAGAYCERVDEQIYDETILNRIYNQIAKADIIVSDMSDRNPNVFYETGYAHALGKHVILLTQRKKDVPFDLKNFPHIIYGGKIADNLKPTLEERVRWCILNPKMSLAKAEFNLKIYYQGTPLEEHPEIVLPHFVREYGGQANIRFDLHNPTGRTFHEPFSLGIVTPPPFSANATRGQIKLPDGKYLHYSTQVLSVLPNCWHTVEFNLLLEGNVVEGTYDVYDAIVKVFGELETQEFPVTMRVLPEPDRTPKRNFGL
jgi:hypothetical protein